MKRVIVCIKKFDKQDLSQKCAAWKDFGLWRWDFGSFSLKNRVECAVKGGEGWGELEVKSLDQDKAPYKSLASK